MKKNLGVIVILFMVSLTYGVTYYWPLPDAPDWYTRGTFCEYRTGHFHEGIDIPATGFWTVWSATYWCKCIDFGDIIQGGVNMGKYVTIQHYTDSSTAIDEGTRYLHMWDINDILQREQVYEDLVISLMTDFYENHLHFEMREPAPEISDDKNSFNLFVDYSLTDNYEPVLDYLYADGDPGHQGDATIDCWNFLGYDFSNYYNSTAVAPFIRLLLPAESRDNDLDDPHILIGDNCKVRFILKAKDRVSSGYSENCAPYWISLYLNTALAPEEEDDPIITGSLPFYEVKFEQIENEFGENEVYDEEDVYHTSSPLISDQSTFYYRLYPIDVNSDGLPGCILKGGSTVLETENLDEGQHRIRIVAKDYCGNIKTADAHFYKRIEDWVDYCRAFDDE